MKVDVLKINFDLVGHLYSSDIPSPYAEKINMKNLNELLVKLKADSQKLIGKINTGIHTRKDIESVKQLAGILLISIFENSNRQCTEEFQGYKNKISELIIELNANEPKNAKEVVRPLTNALSASMEVSSLEKRILALPFFEYFNNLDEINPSSTPPLTNREILQNVTNTINSIKEMPKKMDLLRHVLNTGDWKNPEFDLPLEDELTRERNASWDYEMPFVGILALTENLIDEDEFCQLMSYFALRREYSIEEIEIVKPPMLCQDQENNDRWQEALFKVTNQPIFIEFPGLYEFEFELLKKNIEERCKSNPGKSVLFLYDSLIEEMPYPMGVALKYADFRLFYHEETGDPYMHRVAVPQLLYQEILKIFFPESYLTLVPKCGFTPIEKQIRRRSNEKNWGEVDIAYPCPGICEPSSKKFPEKNLMADGYYVPGCDLTNHDYFHAFAASGLPPVYRDYLLDLAEKLVTEEEFWKERKIQFKELLHKKNMNLDESINLPIFFRDRIFDLEHPAKEFIKRIGWSRKLYHPKSIMQDALLTYGRDLFGVFLCSLIDLPDAPWRKRHQVNFLNLSNV